MKSLEVRGQSLESRRINALGFNGLAPAAVSGRLLRRTWPASAGTIGEARREGSVSPNSGTADSETARA